jgi:hypothetical protein
VLLPFRPKLFVDLHMGGIGVRAGKLALDDEKKLSIALNVITFQRTWRIPPPPTGLSLFGRGLVSSAFLRGRHAQMTRLYLVRSLIVK